MIEMKGRSVRDLNQKLFGRHYRDGAGFEVSRVPGEDDPGAADNGCRDLQGVFEVPHAELERGEGIEFPVSATSTQARRSMIN
jgi:hypothetical protein